MKQKSIKRKGIMKTKNPNECDECDESDEDDDNNKREQ